MPSASQNPIPIKNLFYMLCYAWNVLPMLNDIKVGDEDIEDAANLLARVFSYGVARIVRSGFHRSYVEKEEELGGVKGRINIQESINCMSMQTRRLVCNFDEYSTNDIFNQIIKYTMNSIIGNDQIDKNTRKDLKNLSVFFTDIDSRAPTKENRTKLVFNRNNMVYRMLISIAIMLYENSFINEETGKILFKDFFKEKQMHKVFEVFILNFYATKLDKQNYKVHAPKIKWPLDDEADDTWNGLFEVDDDYGDRRTDIVIENKELNLQIIMDAKYYHKTFVNAYMGDDENSIRDQHISQVRNYIIDSTFPGYKVGALVYPMTTNDLKDGRVKPIKGTNIVYKTINLAADWKDIEEDMLSFLGKFEEGERRRVSHR